MRCNKRILILWALSTVLCQIVAPVWALPPDLRAATTAEGEAELVAGLADRYVADFVAHERLVVNSAVLDEEVQRLEGIGAAGGPLSDLADSLTRLEPATRSAIAITLRDGSQPVLDNLDAALSDLHRQTGELTSVWQAARRSLNQDQFLLFRVKASRRLNSQLASLLSVDKRWFWLFGLIAVGCMLGVVLHDRRREVRRMVHGGRARAMGLTKLLTLAMFLLGALTMATFVMGDKIYEALLVLGSATEASPRQVIEDRNADIRQNLKTAEASYRQQQARYNQSLATCQTRLAHGTGGMAPLTPLWKDFRTRVLNFAAETTLLERLPAAVQGDLAELGQVREELAVNTEATVRYLRLRQVIRGSLGLALLGLTTFGGVFFWRGRRQRRETTAATCPLCLGRDSLVADRSDGLGMTAEAFGTVRCRNVISQQPYEECDYSFATAYQPMAKLCFPTLGVPQAGKTHWLAMLYWALGRGEFPPSVEFHKLKSRTSEDFDVLVEEILTSRIGTAATQRERIPHPVVFNFRDRDRYGRSNLLVNIFDYSGEVTLDMRVDDYRRRRALAADGYLFFLDPTYPTAPQAKALADFREDLRLLQAVKTGKRIRTPVALCVSKIDMLGGPGSASGSGDWIGQFFQDLARIDPSGDAITLDVIEARSRLVARLRETIWPGWQVERQVRELFGGRFMFFPLSPVGLEGRGESDLSLRTISPFGLLEPLLWLLQMNGYCVLR